MASSQSRVRRTAAWHTVFLALGLVLFAGLIYGVGFRAVWEALQRLGWLTPLILIPYITAYIMDSIGWMWVLRRYFAPAVGNPVPAPGLMHFFTIRAAGEAVNGITPAAFLGGEPVKARLLQQHGVPLVPGLASILVSKTALMLTQGSFVFMGGLVALHHWRSEIPLPAAALIGLLLGGLTFWLIIGVHHRGLFGILLGMSRRWSGREALLASWEADLLALDDHLRGFYKNRSRDFLVCCGFHFLGWVVGVWEVYLVLWLLGESVDFLTAFSIEALSGVAKLAGFIVPGSLGVQEGGQVVIFAAFGLAAPLAVTFSLLRRGRELLWIGFGLAVLVRHHALGWLRGRQATTREV